MAAGLLDPVWVPSSSMELICLFEAVGTNKKSNLDMCSAAERTDEDSGVVEDMTFAEFESWKLRRELMEEICGGKEYIINIFSFDFSG